MMKMIGLFCLVACLLGGPIVAGDGSNSNDDYSFEEDTFLPTILEQHDRADLEDVALYVEDLVVEQNVDPTQIALVIDVDGTLTNYSEPREHQGPAQARGNAVAFVTECVRRGIKVAVASAWPHFRETIQRLKDIGLGDILGIMAGDIQEGEEDLFGMSVQYARLGYVASVKRKESSEYKLKGLAYHYIYPGLDLKAIKHWVLGDDNSGNVLLFKECIFDIYRKSQIAKEALPAGMFVKMFCLSTARGEATLK